MAKLEIIGSGGVLRTSPYKVILDGNAIKGISDMNINIEADEPLSVTFTVLLSEVTVGKE